MKSIIQLFKTLICILLLTACTMILFSSGCKNDRDSKNEVLWYKQPAKEWHEALPLGNGRMGSMIFGGVTEERIQLNEESLWAGEQFESAPIDFYQNLKLIQKMVLNGDLVMADSLGQRLLTKEPTSFRSYEPLGDIYIKMKHGAENYTDYRRELDLRDGMCRVLYKINDIKYVREYLLSAEDDILAIHLSASKPGSISGKFDITRWKDTKITTTGMDQLNLDGQIVDSEDWPSNLPKVEDGNYNPGGSGPAGAHMKFAGRMIVMNTAGSVYNMDSSLILDKADNATILFTAATDYNLNKMNYDRSIDAGAKADSIIARARQKSWEEIKKKHIEEHRSIFGRVSLDLGRSKQITTPTNERFDSLKAGLADPGLIELYFQYGRYLLMSSSRFPGRLPANLVGVWSDYKWAPWEADYHLNINLQAEYWPVDQCNLSPCLDPLFGWLTRLAQRGSITAEKLYRAKGWLSYTMTNPFGRTTPSGSTLWSQFNNGVLDPLAGAWMAMTLWRHYEYTQDEAFLRESYPILKGAAEFIADFLVEDKNGWMVVVPSTSPENQYIEPMSRKKIRITKASTYHITITRVIFDAVINSSLILGQDHDVRARLIKLKAQLPPYQFREDGTLQEWIENYEEPEPGHRHLSHLLGLHPFSLITPKDPKLYTGAEKALERRVTHNNIWKFFTANMYARLGKGDKAFQNIKNSICESQHSFFPISGGGCLSGRISGIAEMLLQSNIQDENGNYIVNLLPALPSAWPDGKVHGLLARGGFEVDLTWEKGELSSATIKSSKDRILKLKYKDKTLSYDVKAGQVISFRPDKTIQ